MPASAAPLPRHPFLLEADALAQHHVDAEFRSLLAEERPDLLAVDYLLAARFIRSVYADRRGPKRLTITLNREARFYRDLRQQAAVPPPASPGLVAELRLAAFEQWIHRRSHAVVALSPGDLPGPWPGLQRCVMPPVLAPSAVRWAPSAGHGTRFLYVGNIGHYPNRLAMDWIRTRLALELAARDAGARLRIIGAAVEGVPPAWHVANIDWLGVGDAGLVTAELCATSLFVAPIRNAFGSKIKLLDCLSHGVPFAGTREALTGIPFIKDVPTFDLEHPGTAAGLMLRAAADQPGRARFAAAASDALVAELAGRSRDWSALVGRLLAAGRAAPDMERPAG